MANIKNLLKEYVKLMIAENVDSYPFAVGDRVVPTDGSDYVGKITYISKDEDVVVHEDERTGKQYKKSYHGFPVRYALHQSV